MHLDFVEESYWKRCAAKQFAVDCSIVAIHKAKLRAAKQSRIQLEDQQKHTQEEALRLENLKREEERQKFTEKRELEK